MTGKKKKGPSVSQPQLDKLSFNLDKLNLNAVTRELEASAKVLATETIEYQTSSLVRKAKQAKHAPTTSKPAKPQTVGKRPREDPQLEFDSHLGSCLGNTGLNSVPRVITQNSSPLLRSAPVTIATPIKDSGVSSLTERVRLRMQERKEPEKNHMVDHLATDFTEKWTKSVTPKIDTKDLGSVTSLCSGLENLSFTQTPQMPSSHSAINTKFPMKPSPFSQMNQMKVGAASRDIQTASAQSYNTISSPRNQFKQFSVNESHSTNFILGTPESKTGEALLTNSNVGSKSSTTSAEMLFGKIKSGIDCVGKVKEFDNESFSFFDKAVDNISDKAPVKQTVDNSLTLQKTLQDLLRTPKTNTPDLPTGYKQQTPGLNASSLNASQYGDFNMESSLLNSMCTSLLQSLTPKGVSLTKIEYDNLLATLNEMESDSDNEANGGKVEALDISLTEIEKASSNLKNLNVKLDPIRLPGVSMKDDTLLSKSARKKMRRKERKQNLENAACLSDTSSKGSVKTSKKDGKGMDKDAKQSNEQKKSISGKIEKKKDKMAKLSNEQRKPDSAKKDKSSADKSLNVNSGNKVSNAKGKNTINTHEVANTKSDVKVKQPEHVKSARKVNHETAVNKGTVRNSAGTVNKETAVNKGTVRNSAGTVNNETAVNKGTVRNSAGTVNHETAVNKGTVRNSAGTVNKETAVNKGTVKNSAGTVNNETAANKGTVRNRAGTVNKGTVRNSAGKVNKETVRDEPAEVKSKKGSKCSYQQNLKQSMQTNKTGDTTNSTVLPLLKTESVCLTEGKTGQTTSEIAEGNPGKKKKKKKKKVKKTSAAMDISVDECMQIERDILCAEYLRNALCGSTQKRPITQNTGKFDLSADESLIELIGLSSNITGEDVDSQTQSKLRVLNYRKMLAIEKVHPIPHGAADSMIAQHEEITKDSVQHIADMYVPTTQNIKRNEVSVRQSNTAASWEEVSSRLGHLDLRETASDVNEVSLPNFEEILDTDDIELQEDEEQHVEKFDNEESEVTSKVRYEIPNWKQALSFDLEPYKIVHELPHGENEKDLEIDAYDINVRKTEGIVEVSKHSAEDPEELILPSSVSCYEDYSSEHEVNEDNTKVNKYITGDNETIETSVYTNGVETSEHVSLKQSDKLEEGSKENAEFEKVLVIDGNVDNGPLEKDDDHGFTSIGKSDRKVNGPLKMDDDLRFTSIGKSDRKVNGPLKMDDDLGFTSIGKSDRKVNGPLEMDDDLGFTSIGKSDRKVNGPLEIDDDHGFTSIGKSDRKVNVMDSSLVKTGTSPNGYEMNGNNSDTIKANGGMSVNGVVDCAKGNEESLAIEVASQNGHLVVDDSVFIIEDSDSDETKEQLTNGNGTVNDEHNELPGSDVEEKLEDNVPEMDSGKTIVEQLSNSNGIVNGENDKQLESDVEEKLEDNVPEIDSGKTKEEQLSNSNGIVNGENDKQLESDFEEELEDNVNDKMDSDETKEEQLPNSNGIVNGENDKQLESDFEEELEDNVNDKMDSDETKELISNSNGTVNCEPAKQPESDFEQKSEDSAAKMDKENSCLTAALPDDCKKSVEVEQSPACLADRLKMKLRKTSTRNVLESFTNSTLDW